MNEYQKLKDSFTDKKLFQMALTHRSWVNEHKNDVRSNERLEFLGDAIIEFIVSEIIYKKFGGEEKDILRLFVQKL